MPPVMGSMRLFVVIVVLRCFAEELCQCCNVNGWCSRRLPFATWKTGLDFLEQVSISIWILERRERKVGTTFGVAPAHAWILDAIIEWAAGEVEHLAHLRTSCD